MTAFDLIQCLKQIKQQRVLLTCSPISEYMYAPWVILKLLLFYFRFLDAGAEEKEEGRGGERERIPTDTGADHCH